MIVNPPDEELFGGQLGEVFIVFIFKLEGNELSAVLEGKGSQSKKTVDLHKHGQDDLGDLFQEC